jgi:hypothetical protein
VKLTTPTNDTLSALQALGSELDTATASATDNLRTDHLRANQPEPAGPSPIIRDDELRRRRPRIAIAASLVALVGGAGITAVSLRGNDHLVGANLPINPGDSWPYVLPTYMPDGLCLAEKSTELDVSGFSEALLSLQNAAGGTVFVTASGEGDQVGTPLVGTAAVINGKRGFLSTSGRQRVLGWQQETRYLTAISQSVDDDQLVAVAKQTTFDPTTKQFHTSTEAFEVEPIPVPSSTMQLDYSSCATDSKPQGFHLYASELSTLPVVILSTFSDTIRTLTTDDGRTLKVGVAEIEGDEGRGLIAWTRGNTVFSVRSNLKATETDRIIKGLQRVTKVDIETLVPTAAAPTNAFFEQDREFVGEPTTHEVPWSSPNEKVQTNATADGSRLCVAMIANPGSCSFFSGSASTRPHFYDLRPGQFTGYWASSASVAFVRAVARFPDGHTAELPSIVDDRAPSIRAFLWSQRRDDPHPVEVTYFDKSGKSVYVER